jgi:ATP-dependent exoDNAse (exonuclease V) beta subunit
LVVPCDQALDGLLETVALREGLVDPRQRSGAMRAAKKLLERLRTHTLCAEIDGAAERYHELPYIRPLPDRRSTSGIIDLLYRSDGGWVLVDFKINELRDGEMLSRAIERYRPQIHRYTRAAQALLGAPIKAELCFLDYMGEIRIVSL